MKIPTKHIKFFVSQKSKISKKGQLQLMESTVVLFVFFILLIIGVSIYSNFQASKLERLTSTLNEQKATEIARKVLFTPELECSINSDVTKDCFEIQKLQSFVDNVRFRPRYYREEFGNTKVIIRWVYSPAFDEDNCNTKAPAFFALNPTDTTITVPEKVLFDFSSGLQSKKTFYFPLTLLDKRCVPELSYFGWLIIEAYS